MRKKKLVPIIASCILAVSLGLSGCGASSGPISDEYVQVEKYVGLKVLPVEKTEVTDELVESTIEQNTSAQSTYEKVDREAKDGDQVNIDFVGKVKGKAFDGGSAEGYDLILGSNSFVGAEGDYKGFEEQLIGHKAGEKFDIKVKFPESYSEELKGKVATFTITLNEVKEQKNFELTDETVSTLSSTAKTVDEYKAEIKKQLEDEYEETYKSTLQSEVSNELLANTTIVGDLDSEIEEAFNSDYSYYEQYASAYGMDMESFAQAMAGMSEDQFKAKIKENAKNTIMFKYACNLIASKAGLEMSDSEFKEEATKLAEEYGFTDSTEEASTAAEGSTGEETAKSGVDQFIEQYGEDTIRNYLTQKKVLDYLVEKCEQTNDATTATEAETDTSAETATEASSEAATESSTQAK